MPKLGQLWDNAALTPLVRGFIAATFSSNLDYAREEKNGLFVVLGEPILEAPQATTVAMKPALIVFIAFMSLHLLSRSREIEPMSTGFRCLETTIQCWECHAFSIAAT